MGKINDNQKLFCNEYIIDLHITNAAKRAGYSKKTAYSIGSELLKKPEIRSRIAELMDERSKRTLVDADFVVRNLLDITSRCQQKVPVMVWNHIDKCMEQKKEEDDNGVEQGVWEFDSNGANKALELLGKHLGMFTDNLKTKTEVTSITLKEE